MFSSKFPLLGLRVSKCFKILEQGLGIKAYANWDLFGSLEKKIENTYLKWGCIP